MMSQNFKDHGFLSAIIIYEQKYQPKHKQNHKHSLNRFYHAKQSVTDTLKITSKKSNSKNSDLIDDKFAGQITKFSRALLQNSSRTFTNETENIRLDREMLKKRHTSPEIRQRTFNDVR